MSNLVPFSNYLEVNPARYIPDGLNLASKVSFVPMADVSESGHWFGSQVRRLNEVTSGFTNFKNNDVLVAKITPCFENGKGAFVSDLENGVGFGSTEFHVLRAKQGTCARFIFHVTQWPQFRLSSERFMTGSAGQKRVQTLAFSQFEIGDFDEDEQATIATILDTLDTQIRQTEAIIAKLQQAKQGLLHDLLTCGIDESGQLRPPYEQAPELYKDSPLGWIPKEWDFGDISKALSTGCLIAIQDGNHGEIHPKTSDFVEEGIPFVMANDIVDGNIKFEACYKITRKQFEGLRIGFAKKDDVLLSHKGTVGQVAVVPSDVDEIMLTPQVTYYRCQPERLLPKFLAIWFKTSFFKEKLLSLSAQSTRAYIGILGQRQLPFMFIPHDEQLEIVSFYGSTEERIALEHRALIKLKKQKAGLMDDLLTGRVRVTELIEQEKQAS